MRNVRKFGRLVAEGSAAVVANRNNEVNRRTHAAAALAALKERLLREQILTASDAVTLPRLRSAADEAASLAWATTYPLLVLPELFLEKVVEATRRSYRQRVIRSRTQRIVALSE